MKADIGRTSSPFSPWLAAIRRHRHVFYVLFLVVTCGLLVQTAARKGGLWDPERTNDFLAYHQAARACLDGDLHTAYDHPEKPYQYPPSLAALIVPLGLLSYRAALAIWILMLLVLFLVTFRSLDEVLGAPVKGIDKMMGLLLAFRLLQSDFANSNANTLVLALVVLGFLAVRRDRAVLGGLLLSLAAAIKVFPILLAPWLLYKKRFRLSLSFLGGLVLWGCLVPGAIVGPRDTLTCYERWLGDMGGPSAGVAEAPELERGAYVAGQSLRTFWFHLLRETDASAHDDDIFTVHVAHLSMTTVENVYRVTGGLLLLAGLWIFWRRGHARLFSGPEIALALLLAVVLSPLARKAHFVMIWPAAVLAFSIARVSRGPRRRLLHGAWIAALLLVVFTSPGALGPWLSKRVMAFAPLTWASLLLAAVVVVPPLAGWRGRTSDAPCSKMDPAVFSGETPAEGGDPAVPPPSGNP